MFPSSMKIWKIIILAATVLAVCCGGPAAFAGTNSLVTYTFVNGGYLDGKDGVPGGVNATAVESGVTITILDVIGLDGSRASAGVHLHETNIGSSGGLGINTDGSDLPLYFESAAGGTGEGFEFSFNKDVYLQNINLANTTAAGTLTLKSGAFADIAMVGAASGNNSLGNTFVAANTMIGIYFSANDGASAISGPRIMSFSVLAETNSWVQDPTRPNILIITTDQQFADVMGCAGTGGLSTPAMDSIAANGVRFTEAYVNYPVCLPHRYSIYTGRLPCNRRLADPNNKPVISVGNQARAAGYNTAYYGKWHIQDQTFERADTANHGFEICEGGRDISMTDSAVAFLSVEKAAPFLAVVSYYNPHDICEWGRKKAGRTEGIDMLNGDVDINPPLAECPPLPSNYAINPDEAEAVTVRRSLYDNGLPNAQLMAMAFTPDEWRQYRWAYHRLVELVDLQIGRVLQALEDNGLADNMVIIFTSDHGDGYAAHRWHQKSVLYEESVRVPFIISYPGNTRENETDQRLVSVGIDLIATISDIVNVEMPEGPYYGKSALPFVFDATTNAPAHEYVVTEAEVDGTYIGRSLRTQDFKYHVWDIGGYREQLFDMVNDRGETNNLANDPAYAAELRRHRELLFADWLVRTDDLFGQTDSDGDGLSDVAEKTMSLSDPALRDSDRDGQTDYEEWLVGSDPMVYSSPFVIPAGTPSNQAYRIEWPSLERRTYTLYRAESLLTNDWKAVYSAAGTGGEMACQDVSGTNAFYRLKVQKF